MIAIAFKAMGGRTIGVLEVLNKREGSLDEDDVGILSIVSAITATSIEQARLYEEAKLAEVVRMLGDISHDIKNLLMPVVCGAGLMQDDLKELLKDALKRGDKQARESFDRCNEVVGDDGELDTTYSASRKRDRGLRQGTHYSTRVQAMQL